MGLTGKAETIAPRPTLAKLATVVAVPILAVLLAAAAPSKMSPAAPLSNSDALLYRTAFLAMAAGTWNASLAVAGQASDPLLAKVLHAHDLAREDGDAEFDEVAGFLTANPDWPNRSVLRLQAERLMPPTLPVDRVAAWFDTHPPLTFDGTMRYADALSDLERSDDLRQYLKQRWTGIALNATQRDILIGRYGDLLSAEDHAARLDALVWAQRRTEAREMYPLVDRDLSAVAEARLRLAGNRSGVDVAVDAVPAELAEDEGLVYERVRWRRRADRTEGAIELLALQPERPSQPRRWWTERNILARRLFSDGDHEGAYALASVHRQREGFQLAQAEWLSGWLALRFIDRPDLALGHFQRLYDNVGTPISLARGAYWTAATHEALGDADEALRWYRTAAAYDTVFYGQLAAGRLGLPSVATLPADPSVPPAVAAEFEHDEFVRIVRALHQIGAAERADPYLRALANGAEDSDRTVLTVRLALATQRRHIAVREAKQAVADGQLLVE
ncbi:MAG: lytic transglycosylase domain-containing protein, partial [Alphaproteobacteria bacterium]